MTDSTLVPFDFRAANAWDPVTEVFQNWMEATTSNFGEAWLTATESNMDLVFQQVKTIPFEKAIGSRQHELVGTLVTFPSIDSTLYIAIARVDFLKVVRAVLGFTDVETEDRVLTRVEMNIGNLLFELMTFSLSESWVGPEKLDGKNGELELNPKRTKSLDVHQSVFASELVLEFHNQQCELLMLVPDAAISKQLKTFTNQVTTEQPQDPRQVLEKLPLKSMCLLGEAEMSMGELSKLKKGDMLFLDQRIDNPLIVSVDDSVLFDCWPGKVGNRQAIEVNKVFEGRR